MSEGRNKNPINSLKLKFPIEWGEEGPLRVVDFLRRPQARDLKGINLQNLKIEDQCGILANITNAEKAQLMRADMYDIQKLADILNDFLEGGQATGKKQ